MKGFLQVDSYSPVGFCLTQVPVAMMIEETDGYTMGQRGCKKLAGSEFVKRHDDTLKVLAVNWAIENGLLPEETTWYTVNLKREKVIENDEKKLYWDWEH